MYSTDPDFTSNGDDILNYLKADRSAWVCVYPFNTDIPDDDRFLYYTYRGILIEDKDRGDREADATKEAVLTRYGVALSGEFDPKQDTIYGQLGKKATRAAMGKSTTWLLYNYQDAGQIKFYFDAEDRLSIVVYFKGIGETADKETTKRIQEYLNENGYDCGTPDGIAGKKTRAMLSKFQKDHGMFASGYIDDSLMKYLDGQP